jgi:hypothetical protein
MLKSTSKSEVSDVARSLLDEVLATHGGIERWRSVTTITAWGRIGGLLPRRFAGNKLAEFLVRVRVAEQHTVLHGFPEAGMRAVFDQGVVRIERDDGECLQRRVDPRLSFSGLSGLRRNVRWDPLDVAYFAGYAFWNYLTSPLLLTHDDVIVTDDGHRRLQATFGGGLDTHCREQAFRVGHDGLITRHDFVAKPVGRWASATLRCDRHREFGGLVFATRRRVFPRGPGGLVLPRPTLLALEFDDIEVER